MEALSSGGPTIMNLPDDCFFLIFQPLDCSCDRESFGLTCNRWLHIENRSRRSLRSRLTININSFHLHRLLTRFQHLESLALSGCTELVDLNLTLLEHCGSNLQSLCLDGCFGIIDDGLFLVATYGPWLTVISLYRGNITDAGLETLAKACSALEDVNLSYCALVTDHGIQALSQGCRQLRSVRMSFSKKISGVGFKGCSPTLAYVEAESCRLRPEGIKRLLSGGGLEYLNVSRASCCIFGGMVAVGTGIAKGLKILDIRRCSSVGNASIAAIAKGCPLLQEWNLAFCHEVWSSGWQSIGLNCNNLEKLHVNGGRRFWDHDLLASRRGWKRLCVLYMSLFDHITSTARELFKFYRPDVDIREEETILIGHYYLNVQPG